MRDAFLRARDYKQAWDDFKAKKTRVPPRRDLELEPIVEIIEGKRLVHAHGYRSDEHLNLMLLADEFGFRVATLQHGLEAYKIAPEIAETRHRRLDIYGQLELQARSLRRDPVRRLYPLEKWRRCLDKLRFRRAYAKAQSRRCQGDEIRRRPEEDALKMITLNPAKQLGIDKRTGSLRGRKGR